MSFALQVTRFPPTTVAIKIAIALATGMLVGFERESANTRQDFLRFLCEHGEACL